MNEPRTDPGEGPSDRSLYDRLVRGPDGETWYRCLWRGVHPTMTGSILCSLTERRTPCHRDEKESRT